MKTHFLVDRGLVDGRRRWSFQCGRWVEDFYPIAKRRGQLSYALMTVDPRDVTCKHCLRSMIKENERYEAQWTH